MLNLKSSQPFFFALWVSMLVGSQATTAQSIPALNVEPLELMQAEEDAFQAAVDSVQPSVVQIETFGGLQMVENATVSEGPSSGTIVGEEGWIITSQFQFRNDPASITVVLADGTRKAARVVARDESRELVLLKIEVDQPLPVPPSISRSQLQVGQWAIALGKTFDPAIASRSIGIVSAIDRIWGKAVQADAKISPMNYGGPLIDIQGRVIGIIAPVDPGIATEGEVQQWYDSGIGFAVPMEDVLARLKSMQTGQDIRRGLLGFRPKGRDDFNKESIIAGVIPGTPLAEAGFRQGDIIRKINDQDVKFVNHMRHLLGRLDAGQVVSVTVERDGQMITKDCELVAELPVYSTPHLGLIPEYDVGKKQLTIQAIESGGPADQAGLKVGEVILQLAGEPVDSIAKFKNQLDFKDYRRSLKVQVAAPDQNDPREVEVTLTRWPESKDLDLPNADQASVKEQNDAPDSVAMRTDGVIELPFADIPNKGVAYIPTGPQSQAMGVLIFAAEPGVDVDREKVVDAWQNFCREQDFAVCVITSAEPQAWSMEELQVFDRALGHLKDKYAVDDRLVVVGGFGAGGTIAMVAAFERSTVYRALVFGADRVPAASAKIPAVEPQNGVDLLFGPENKQVTSFKDALFAKGYRTESLNAEYKIDDDASSAAGVQLRRYLATLRWY